MDIGIFGASGTIGQRVIAEALTRGHRVTAFTSDPSRVGSVKPGIVWKHANVLDAESIAQVISNVDVIVNSYGPGPSSNAEGKYELAALERAIHNAGSLVVAAHALLKALTQRPNLRLIVVGGAGSLEIAPGLQAVDSGPGLVAALENLGLPEEYKAVVAAHRDALNIYRASNRNWTYFSPAHLTVPGERTGRFRLGHDQILIGEDGRSRISCEDCAVALLDEVELARHVQRRFTIGY